MSDKLKQEAEQFLQDFESVPEARNLYGVRTVLEKLLAELERQAAEIEELEQALKGGE